VNEEEIEKVLEKIESEDLIGYLEDMSDEMCYNIVKYILDKENEKNYKRFLSVLLPLSDETDHLHDRMLKYLLSLGRINEGGFLEPEPETPPIKTKRIRLPGETRKFE